MSLKDHLEAVERQTGKKLEELKLPDFPEALSYVWRIFISLSNTRGQGFSGGSPITFEQMKAYMDLTGNYIGPKEVDVILKLDREYLRIMNSG